jgi:hypothetical protein
MDKEYEIKVESPFKAELHEVVIEPVDQASEGFGDALPSEATTVVIDPNDDMGTHEFRRVIRANIVDNLDRSQRRVNITLVAQRRKRSEEWRDAAEYTLANLRGGEEARIYLDAAETWELFETLQDLYKISRSGEPSGERNVYIVRRGADGKRSVPVQDIIDLLSEGSEEVWEQVTTLRPNIPLALALHKMHAVRAEAVAEFEQHMANGDWDEGDWQNFFGRNPWIFGHGLAYHILDTVQEQANYGGQTLTGRGGQRGDFLTATRAEIKFTVLVEIKRPDTRLMKRDQYRNKVYGISDELAGGVGQLQSNCRNWVIEGARQDENREILEDQDIYTYEPKGILVIGCTSELANDRNKRASFELFRRNLNNPEILTFDELLSRAKFMISHDMEQQKTHKQSDAGDAPREP